jgi:hypothetical protein
MWFTAALRRRLPLESRLEVGSARGNCRRRHQFPDPHVVQVIVKLFSALKTGDVGISGLGPRLMDRRYRPGELPVAATIQQVQHGVDHAFSLQTAAEGGLFALV